jgi:hypothetical protein
MAKIPNKEFRVTLEIEGIAKFEKLISLDGGDFIEQIKGLHEACRGLELTIAQAVLSPSLFQQYLERTEM